MLSSPSAAPDTEHKSIYESYDMLQTEWNRSGEWSSIFKNGFISGKYYPILKMFLKIWAKTLTEVYIFLFVLTIYAK